MERKKGTWLMRLGLLLMLAAAVLAGRNMLEQYQAGQASVQVLASLREEIAASQTSQTSQVSQTAQTAPTAPTSQVSQVSQVSQTAAAPAPFASVEPQETPLFVRYPNMEMPVRRVGGHEYIGVVDIPSKEISLPVMSDWDYDKLRVAPCRYSGSVYSGDLVIAGHNYDTHFRPIKDLLIGDKLTFTDADGNVFHFEVMGIETVGPNNVGTMLAGDWEMTLFTCTIGGQMRAAVRCRQTGYTLPQTY